jgi:hypothetical protein
MLFVFALGVALPTSSEEGPDTKSWLDKRGLSDHAAAFAKHKVDLDILAEVTVDDLKEMGLEVGPRHKAANHIAQWIDAKAGNHHGAVALLSVAPDGTGGSDGPDMSSWLEKRSLSEHLALFGKHKVDLDVLAEVSYDDLKEMGIHEVGPRRKVAKHIATFAEAKGKAKMALASDKAVALAAAQVDGPSMKDWLEKRKLAEHAALFSKHQVDLDTLAQLTYDDLKEIGFAQVGPRRKASQHIAHWIQAKAAGGHGSAVALLASDQAEGPSMKDWLEKRGLSAYGSAFSKHKVDLDTLGDVTVDDLKEMGLAVGPRHKTANHINTWVKAKAGNHKGSAGHSLMA